ncbi:MAG: MBL fold metallo-hydrolase [Verrucomicrobiota bacterium]
MNSYVLRDGEELFLLDAGFIGGRTLLRRALRRTGWQERWIKGIIVTHGHLDHILNVGRFAEEFGAWIAAPRLDEDHYAGRPTYSGWARTTQVLEALGRPLLRFRAFEPDRLLDDGDEINIWRGLRVVHLPGHTDGHCGLYCEKRKLLFSGDLYASYGPFQYFPPAIFNDNGREMPRSARRALELDLEGILPNHGDRASPEVHLERLRKLVGKYS